ncbi:acireductone synthase [Salinispirillum sp. LH 10-3-1]|uniref:Enolase-phosphatase E1 n=1 Tax=Salinispirillum sp. LH 10-3-1 TaxID=2952525 RepID=A0AB38YFM5_9GAMM
MATLELTNIKAIVTDIEGTTTDIAFVQDVLFPYAYQALPAFVRRHSESPEVAAQLEAVKLEMGQPDAAMDALIDQLLLWIDTDQKVTPLKALQGMVWIQGYETGDFTAHLYDDVAPNLQRWAAAGKALYVYSSGSVQAQKLLFAHTPAGDLTPLFSDYFDTRIGHKREVASYAQIVQKVGLPADTILFLSDIVEELDAAREAGLQTVQLVRPGTESSQAHPTVTDFNQLVL